MVLSTCNSRPTAYRLTLPEAGGGRTQTALAAEVLHFRTGCDLAVLYIGTAPLRRSSLTAGLLHAIETALSEVYDNAPMGSQIVPYPEVIPPFLTWCIRRTYAAIFSFWAGVMPPMAMFGRSLL
ncbi:hypothetical protein IMCC21224_112695 [Puniceibacterium sp. IMCC21224]|nr:hypothetical protein IMCC21224_112695 [Puniceibacterium sp. IMCC21224]